MSQANGSTSTQARQGSQNGSSRSNPTGYSQLEYNQVAQTEYLKALKAGKLLSERPSFEQEKEPFVQKLETLARKSNGNVRAIETLIKQLLARMPEMKAYFETQEQAEFEVTRNEAIFPPLPECIQFSPEVSKNACVWLNEYEQHSSLWSPRGYKYFHTAVGAWLLSTVAGRRVWVPFGPGGEYTPLFLALVARTTGHAKSTTANIGKDTLREAGLFWRLSPDTITPQKLLSNMSGQFPQNYDSLSVAEQALAKNRYAMSGQVGWFYNEFGQHLDAMTAKNGIMADFKGILRRFDDCDKETSNDTIARGLERIESPYMSLLASMTPSDIKPYAGKDAKFWRDGFFARFAFITPPLDDRNRSRFPEGEMSIPASLVNPLKNWHSRLGEPSLEIIAETNKKGETIGYQLVRGDMPRQVCTLGPGVIEAYYAYSDALDDIIYAHNLEQLEGNYGRMAKKALRLAMLFASLENNGKIELRHWAKGQEIAEQWRESLHELYAQVTSCDYSEGDSLENDLIKFLDTRQEALTVREIKASYRQARAVDSIVLRDALAALVKDDIVTFNKVGRAERYQRKAHE